MPEFVYTSRDQIQRAKEEIGALSVIEIKADSFADAHRQLGERNKSRIQKTLLELIDATPAEGEEEEFIPFSDALLTAKNCRIKMLAKAEELSQSDPGLAEAIKEYLDCVKSWAKGAGIDKLELGGVDQSDFVDIALVLQGINVGCQSIMVRTENGIDFAHTEERESTDEIFTSEWVKFNIPGEDPRSAFIWPELLPGPAFSFNGAFMSVDLLYVDSPETIQKEGGFLANAAAWILWRSADGPNSLEIIKKLSPFYDGYAVNLIYPQDGEITGETIEFAGNFIKSRKLDSTPGEMQIQVNNISEEAIREGFVTESYMPGESREDYERRVLRIVRATKLAGGFSQEIIRRILGFKIGKLSSASEIVQAYVVGSITSKNLSMSIAAGPAVKNELSQYRFSASPK